MKKTLAVILAAVMMLMAGGALAVRNHFGDAGRVMYARERFEDAVVLFKIGASNDEPDSMYRLAQCYHWGDGIKVDVLKARYWFESAFKAYEQAAAAGDAGAMRGLGDMYCDDEDYGAPQDLSMALAWYQKAAAAGDAQAMQYIGDFYAAGDGVAQSAEKAAQWYHKAAETGDSEAMLRLGTEYFHGNVVKQDYGKAFEWILKAAQLNNGDAMYWAADMYSAGLGVRKDKAKADEWEKRMEQAFADELKAAENTLGTAQNFMKMLKDRGVKL